MLCLSRASPRNEDTDVCVRLLEPTPGGEGRDALSYRGELSGRHLGRGCERGAHGGEASGQNKAEPHEPEALHRILEDVRGGQDSEDDNADTCERKTSGQETCGAGGGRTDGCADMGGEARIGNSINVKKEILWIKKNLTRQ